jgi:hypothetical protein
MQQLFFPASLSGTKVQESKEKQWVHSLEPGSEYGNLSCVWYGSPCFVIGIGLYCHVFNRMLMAKFLVMVQISMKLLRSERNSYLGWKSGQMAWVLTGTHCWHGKTCDHLLFTCNWIGNGWVTQWVMRLWPIPLPTETYTHIPRVYRLTGQGHTGRSWAGQGYLLVVGHCYAWQVRVQDRDKFIKARGEDEIRSKMWVVLDSEEVRHLAYHAIAP